MQVELFQLIEANLVTTTTTFSSPSPSIEFRMGRPAVPEGSPSSLERCDFSPHQAQQLCRAFGSETRSINSLALLNVTAGAQRATNRLFFTVSSSSCSKATVVIVDETAKVRRSGAFRVTWRRAPILVERESPEHVLCSNAVSAIDIQIECPSICTTILKSNVDWDLEGVEVGGGTFKEDGSRLKGPERRVGRNHWRPRIARS